jgi:isopentenyl-diphosphate delta-isomerase
MKSPVKVHFVCRGNLYRSRMAAHYLETLQIDGIEVSSSGVDAALHADLGNKIMADRPVELAHWIGFQTWAKNLHPLQTTQELLDDADLIVFMNDDVAHDAQLRYQLNLATCEVWDVADLDERLKLKHKKPTDRKASRRIIEATHRYVKQRVDQLVHDITISGMTDIVDEGDRPMGYAIPVAWANRKGLWFRGIHIVLLTADHKVITEKRSRTIMFSPSRLDFSVGGGVGTRESYEEAACRETREELGIQIQPTDLQLLETREVVAKSSHYHVTERVHLKTYLAVLTEKKPEVKKQVAEVAQVYFISLPQIRRLVRLRRLVHFGLLESNQAYYRDILSETERQLRLSR